MQTRTIVDQAQWRKERLALLEREKAFTHEREALAQARREMPWVKIDAPYTFATERGPESLAQLFAGCSQLLVYHFMFGPDWKQGCPSCSFWADNYAGTLPHLRARDVNLVAVSRGPLDQLLAYRKRMGWSFDWVSSAGGTFNFDFAVSFPESTDADDDAANYNFATERFNSEEAPGLSVFYRDEDDTVYHTYSCYARGLDTFNGAYQYLDVVPKGRDEAGLAWPMQWVRRHDEY